LAGLVDAVCAVDAIYQDNETSGTVFVGNQTAAEGLEILKSSNICNVVNCTRSMENFHQDVDGFNYFRFDISNWMSVIPKKRTVSDVIGFFGPVFDFIEKALQRGENVLIHCLAGAHRAGTTGVVFLMYKLKHGYSNAVKAAKLCRPIINPIGLLKTLAGLYEKAQTKAEAKRVLAAEQNKELTAEQN